MMKFKELREVIERGDFEGDPYLVYIFIDGNIARTDSECFLLRSLDNCAVERIWPFDYPEPGIRVDLKSPEETKDQHEERGT